MVKSKKRITSKTKLANKHSNKQFKQKNVRNYPETLIDNKAKLFSRKGKVKKKQKKDELSHGLFTKDLLPSMDDAVDESSSCEELNEEDDYDKYKNRLSNYAEDNDTLKLPIKSSKAVILQQKKSPDQSMDIIEENEDQSLDNEEIKKTETLDWSNILLEKKKEVTEKKIEVATLSQALVEDPETNISNLKKLIGFCRRDQPSQIRKLSIISLMEIFKDITPSYQIRELSDVEKNVQMKKDTIKLHDYEESLLSSYRSYLQLLEDNIKEFISLWKKRRKIRENLSQEKFSSLALISFKSMSSLLIHNTHFNFRNNIVMVLVSSFQQLSSHAQICNICKGTLQEVLSNDRNGDVSLEIVRAIHNLVKNNQNITPQLLEPLLCLQVNIDLLREVKVEKADGKDKKLMSRKEKKRKKVEDKLNKELQETEAVDRREKIAKTYLEVTKLLFGTYFRVIKMAANHASLLSVVLKGISKYSHCISIEFIDPIVTTLKELIKTNLPTIDKLCCVSAIMKILSGQGELLLMDPSELYQEFYDLMLVITNDGEESMKLYNSCLDMMLIKRRKQVSTLQSQGYFKRIATMLLQLDSFWLEEWLCLLRKLLQQCSRCSLLLDNEDYTSDSIHGNFFHSQCMTLWDVLLVNKHYLPNVRSYVKQHFLSQQTEISNLRFTLQKSDQHVKSHRNTENEALSRVVSYLDDSPQVKTSHGFTNTHLSHNLIDFLESRKKSINAELETFFPKLLENDIFIDDAFS